MRSLLTISCILGLSAGVASAQPWNPYNPSQQRRTQPQTEERYQARNQLTTVRLEPGRNRAYIQLPRTGRPLNYLEIRAGRMRVTLDNVQVLLEDGTTIDSGDRGTVEPFEGRVIDLPRSGARPKAIIAQYRTENHRRGARLTVFGVPEHRGYAERTRPTDFWRR
jgi:hypothetical protein